MANKTNNHQNSHQVLALQRDGKWIAKSTNSAKTTSPEYNEVRATPPVVSRVENPQTIISTKITHKNPTSYSRTSATARAVYLPKANTEGGAAGYNRGKALGIESNDEADT